jgi:nicotinamide mononucleotide (NMN) deamidase PncC
MAEGGSDDGVVCIAVSGIAGPAGGSDDKPVGTVWIAVALPGESAVTQLLSLSGSRSEVQWRTVNAALTLLLAQVEKSRI